ncbi:CubicO group peptidase, beta-lactamase class C family [Fodinibius roseus]|uniref:CubicO group peptidase, beta-lactamase class C family n=1 Tax=Fodinibius roseus TaxID=1194090 RepID=A0A1M4TDY3_9BACT|nr:serine hydrolase domain-containing protein [Fodinibius roseus]SHE42574.1 CubicO group peptidase, beta-lactamase class C family [Fodinibius roseus]
MLKPKYLFTCLFTVFAFTAFSQTPSVQTSPPLVEGEATSEGMSEERLSRIDMMLEEAVEDKQIPGAVALVARNGTIVYHKAFGTADSETGRTLREDDIFRIASQTKAVTATAVMMLWEEGKFRLDDPIAKYIPGFKDAQILDSFNAEDTTYTTQPADKPVTIRHLLTHTSGIGYGMIDGDDRFRKIYQKAGVTDLFTTKDITIGESVKKLAKLPLHHHPGEAFTYSEGLDVLGYFIEKVSGMPLNEFFRSRIFNPLGMEDTWFYLPESKHRRLVPVLTKEGDSWKHYPVTFYDPDYPVEGEKQFYSGGAGLSSTAEDYATFLQMYLNKGELNGMRLLSRTTVEFMMKNQVGDLRGGGQDYGLAFGLVNQKGEIMGGQGSKGTFYWGGYFNTQYFADPEEQVIGILMKQTQGTSDETSWKFKQLVGQAIDN